MSFDTFAFFFALHVLKLELEFDRTRGVLGRAFEVIPLFAALLLLENELEEELEDELDIDCRTMGVLVRVV